MARKIRVGRQRWALGVASFGLALLFCAGPATAFICQVNSCTCQASDVSDCMNMATHCKAGTVTPHTDQGTMECILEDSSPLPGGAPVPLPALNGPIAARRTRELELLALGIGALGIVVAIVAVATRRGRAGPA